MLKTAKTGKVALLLVAIYKKGGLFKYPNIFKCDNVTEFNSDVTKLLEKQNGDIRKTTAKHKHIHRAFGKAYNKEFEKELIKPLDTQQL